MGKGGGSGGGAGKIQIPQALGSGPGSLFYNAFTPLGTYASGGLGSLQSLYNWASDIATGGNVAGMPQQLAGNGTLYGSTGQTYAPFTGAGAGTGSGGSGGGLGAGSSILGPILSGEMSNLGNATQSANNFATLINPQDSAQSPFGIGTSLLDKGTGMLNMAMNKGLFPSQQAEINQAVSSQQSAVQQQLGSEGLGSSTVAKELTGQVKMSGAAAAGQLIQGNMQLGETEQQIGEGEQQIGVAAQQALTSEYLGIANQSQSLQAQMYSEALQGAGALGAQMNATLAPFGYAVQTQQDVLQANESEAQLQTQANTAGAAAAQQGFGSLMGGLGSLFGGSGGSGGLLGSLGSSLGGLLGGSGAALGAGGGAGAGALAGAGAGAAGGASGIIGGIGALLSVFSCQIARTVYGVEDIRWVYFRDYLLFRAPRPLRKAYVRNASWISREIRTRPKVKSVFKAAMNLAIWYDKATRTL